LSSKEDKRKKRRKSHKEIKINYLGRNSRDLDYVCEDVHCVIEYIIPYSEIEKLIDR
jgi:hypothetical protein